MNLFKHQTEGIDFLTGRGSGALFMEMGLGKTATALLAYRSMRDKNLSLKMLVFAPLSLLESAWHDDARKFVPELSFRNLRDDLIFDSDISVINYEALYSEKKFQALHSFILRNKVFICADESSRMKSYNSKTTKALLKLSELAENRIIMTGTPAPNSELEYWGQVNFIRPGLLHPSFFAFRNTFFHLQRGSQIMIRQGAYMTAQEARQLFSKGWEYKITPAKREALMKLVDSVSFKRRKVECLDLPEMTDEVRKIEMSAPQAKAYKQMKQYLIAEIEGAEITAQAALTKIMKLRQVTSGFAYDATGASHKIEGANPKTEELLSVIEELGNKQAIIWGNFHHEINELVSLLPDSVTLYSETKDRERSIQDFKGGHKRFLIAHPRSAAHGLTFVNCDTQIFYSLDWSSEAYEQAKGRTHRIGQVNPCTYIHLLANNSIDEDIFNTLKGKRNAQEILWNFTRKNFKDESHELSQAVA